MTATRVAAATLALVACAAACGISAIGTAGSGADEIDAAADNDTPTDVDTSIVRDASADAADVSASDALDAAGDADGDSMTGFRCGSLELPSCLACDAGVYACGVTRTCVADCKTCAGAPVQCVACSVVGGAAAAATCEAPSEAAACMAPPLVRCACDAAADCPGVRQVCKTNGCAACGEDATDTLKCKGPPFNKACDSDGTGNPDDELTCK